MPKVSFCVAGEPPAEVRICGADSHYVFLQVPCPSPEGTRLTLRKGKRTSGGVVAKCEAQKKDFLLTIRVFKGASWLLDLPPEHDFDPGAFSVDNFLSVEQLSLLLAESGGNTHNAR